MKKDDIKAPVANTGTPVPNQAAPANSAPAAKPQAKADAKAEAKEPAKRGRSSIAGDHPLRFVVENYTKDAGNVVFEAKVPGFRSLKVNGNMYAAMTFNKKGLTLWVRGDAVEGIKLPAGTEVMTLNHMFNTRIKFLDTDSKSANNAENIDAIHKLLDASIAFQIAKKENTKKAQSEKAAAARKAEKEAKAKAASAAKDEKAAPPVQTAEK